MINVLIIIIGSFDLNASMYIMRSESEICVYKMILKID